MVNILLYSTPITSVFSDFAHSNTFSLAFQLENDRAMPKAGPESNYFAGMNDFKHRGCNNLPGMNDFSVISRSKIVHTRKIVARGSCKITHTRQIITSDRKKRTAYNRVGGGR